MPSLSTVMSLAPLRPTSVKSTGPALVEAQSYSFDVMGVISAIVYGVATVLTLLYIRRVKT